ncbi:MAG: hypothetical protein R3B11_02890 [Nitrospira sp.]|nr:hypothetical protein [Nitrospira sp.]MDR4474936.1 hypothetical protein [Nitrospira sp.]
MHTSPHTGYAQLKSYLQAWSQLPPSDERLAHEHFARLTEDHLLPELLQLQAVLHDAGIDCTVVRDDSDMGMGLRIDDLRATIGLSPGDQSGSIRAVVSRDGRPNGQIEWFIPYGRIQKGLLERELQAAVMRLLTVRGAVVATPHSGPTP